MSALTDPAGDRNVTWVTGLSLPQQRRAAVWTACSEQQGRRAVGLTALDLGARVPGAPAPWARPPSLGASDPRGRRSPPPPTPASPAAPVPLAPGLAPAADLACAALRPCPLSDPGAPALALVHAPPAAPQARLPVPPPPRPRHGSHGLSARSYLGHVP